MPIPTTTIASIAFSDDTGLSDTDFITSERIQIISGTLSANLMAGETVQISSDNGLSWHQATTITGANAYSWTTTLSKDDTILVKVSNNEGDSAATSQAYVLDQTAPTFSVGSNKASLKAGEVAEITFTLSDAYDLTLNDIFATGGTLSELTGSGSTYTVIFTPTAEATGTANIGLSKYTDLAGNDGSRSAALVQYDTQAPSTPRTPMLPNSMDSGAFGDRITNITTPLLVGDVEADSTVTLYDTDGVTVLNSVVAVGTGHWTLNTSTLSDGEHSLTITATDKAGNVSAPSSPLVLTIDTKAPTVTSIVPSASAVAGATSVTATVTFSEAVIGVDIGDFELIPTGSAIGAIASISGSGTTYTMTIDGIGGEGSLRLNLVDNDSVTDIAANAVSLIGARSSNFILSATLLVAPAFSGGGGSGPRATVTPPTQDNVKKAYEALTTTALDDAGAAAVQADITAGKYSFAEYVNEIVASEKVQTTVVPALIANSFYTARTLTPEHYKNLVDFTSKQLAAYTLQGVANPKLGVYEALGHAFSATPEFKQIVSGLSPTDVITALYQKVFTRAPDAAGLEHFGTQLAYFKECYRHAGESEAEADQHAMGAISGQMLGHGVISIPEFMSANVKLAGNWDTGVPVLL